MRQVWVRLSLFLQVPNHIKEWLVLNIHPYFQFYLLILFPKQVVINLDSYLR